LSRNSPTFRGAVVSAYFCWTVTGGPLQYPETGRVWGHSLTKKNALTKKERLPAKLKLALMRISRRSLRKNRVLFFFVKK
jgi:hypothetical protein